MDEVKTTVDDTSGQRPGRNIEDVERSIMDHLLRGDKTRSYEYDMWQSPLQNIRNYLANQTPKTAETANAARSAGCGPSRKEMGNAADSVSPEAYQEHDYHIDPITNRKVFKTEMPEPVEKIQDIPVKTFKSYRAQFAPERPSKAEKTKNPFFSDGPPPDTEVRKYRQVTKDPFPTEGSHWFYQSGSHLRPAAHPTPENARELTEDELQRYSEYTTTVITDLEPPSDLATRIQGLSKDGQPKPEPAEDMIGAEALSQGEATHDVVGDKDVSIILEDETPKYENLDRYKFTEDSGIAGREIDLPRYSDLDGYGSLTSKTPQSGAEPVKADEYLEKNKPLRWNEPDGFPAMSSEDLPKDYGDYHKYKSVRWNEPHGAPRATQGEISRQHTDVRTYSPVLNNEQYSLPQGNVDQVAQLDTTRDMPVQYQKPTRPSPARTYPVEEKFGEFVTKTDSSELDTDSKPPRSWFKKLRPFFSDPPDSEDLEQLTASDVRARVGYPNLSPRRQALEGEMDRLQNTWDSESKDAQAKVKEIRAISQVETVTPKRDLTGNYVKDFPEEFSSSWSVAESTPNGTLYSSGRVTTPDATDIAYARLLESEVQSQERDDAESTFFPTPTSRLQTALNRQHEATNPVRSGSRNQPQADLYSREPQGLETSYANDSNGDAADAVIFKTHGSVQRIEETTNADIVAVPSKDQDDAAMFGVPDEAVTKTSLEDTIQSAPGESTSELPAKTEPIPTVAPEPTLYKILAYDPTMQMVNIAETTSIVPDNATALPPAEVLLRLSNPTKFFPHFGPLQAQGYEIVSGSGDVLVFRKVRDAVPEPVVMAAAPPRVNPIDMMGSRPILPNTGNFASPTGFVNYDSLAIDGAENKPPPPFRSMIDVRREEPVFSGPKKEQKKPKQRLLRRMVVGGVWVAGIAYAIGVVGEYFSTGGFDGLGPKGF
jgi:hypothetical protein